MLTQAVLPQIDAVLVGLVARGAREGALVCMGSAVGGQVRRLTETATAHGALIRFVPQVRELVGLHGKARVETAATVAAGRRSAAARPLPAATEPAGLRPLSARHVHQPDVVTQCPELEEPLLARRAPMRGGRVRDAQRGGMIGQNVSNQYLPVVRAQAADFT